MSSRGFQYPSSLYSGPEVEDPLQHLTSQLRSVLDLARLPSLQEEEVSSPQEEEVSLPAASSPLLRLPLFSRCPFTDEAQLLQGYQGLVQGRQLHRGQLLGHQSQHSQLHGLNGQLHGLNGQLHGHPSHLDQLLGHHGQLRGLNSHQGQLHGPQDVSRPPLMPIYQQEPARAGLAVRRPWSSNLPPSSPPPSTTSKPSLDSIVCTSLVALTNKQGEGKYWFKSGCPTPDPRWAAGQQLMIGPIPGDVDYSELRTAFLARGHTCHLFIQNNKAWLERNQEKFGARQVKFGYVVYSEADTAERLLREGSIAVRRGSGYHCQVKVKKMDGLPAMFLRN